MTVRIVVLLLTAGCTVLGAGGVDEGRIREALSVPLLEPAEVKGPPPLLLDRVLTARLAQAGAAIRGTQAQLADRAGLAAWQKQTRAACLDALGGFPERTPLNARVTGVIARDGYRVEKILFESRPCFYVTALLFLPDPGRFAPPYPGILIACGHSDSGKGLAIYQRGAVLASANGMAALIYDPIDQGERLQGGGNGNCAGHNRTGVSAALLGWNTASFRVWDGMRALDYLASRPEVDASRLGCMGNSGGGTLTTYLSALDERIMASAPSCYISSLQQVCAALGPQDAEQNLFGQLAFGLEHSGWLLLRAPAATCVCAAQKDMFPIQGTYQTLAEVTSVYARVGAPERVMLAEYEGPHAWAEPLKVAGVRWMNRWMRPGSDLVLPPEKEMGIGPEDARVTEKGQVLQIAGARSVYDLMRDEAARLSHVRAGSAARELRGAVRSRAGIREVRALPVPVTVTRDVTPADGCVIRRVVLKQESGLDLPAALLMPDTPAGTPVLVVDGLGKTNAAAGVTALLRAGRPVLVADVIGFGETQGAAHAFYGASSRDEGPAVMAYLLGTSLVGMRAEDVLVCARWLSVTCGVAAVDVRASNWAVTPALHAAVAEPQLFARVTLSDEPLMWEEVVAQGVRHRFSDVVHGGLKDYTLQELKRAVADPQLTSRQALRDRSKGTRGGE